MSWSHYRQVLSGSRVRWARHVVSREKCLRGLGKGTGREKPLGRPRSG